MRSEASSGANKLEYLPYTPIYTDRSKEGKKVGFAVHTPYGELKGGLPFEASIFTAEASVILRALDWAHVSRHSKFILYSDSKSCLQSILQYSPTNPLVREIKDRITKLKKDKKEIALCWLPSHIGIEEKRQAVLQRKL